MWFKKQSPIVIKSPPERPIRQNLTIYHQEPLTEEFGEIIEEGLQKAHQAHIAPEKYHTLLCLNDGSHYPALIQILMGEDVFRAFANHIVVHGETSERIGTFQKWDQQLSFSQWLSHGLIHNFQYQYHGFWNANPLGQHPEWKWEGYAEYESIGKNQSLHDLLKLYQEAHRDDYDFVHLDEEHSTVHIHLKYLILTKYCFEVLCMDYDGFMADQRTEDELFDALQK